MIFRRRNQTPPSAESITCNLIRGSDLFDAVWYLDQYPDVLQAGFDPVLHYVRHGAQEGRRPGPWFDTERYLASLARDESDIENPLVHYLEHKNEITLIDGKKNREYSDLAGFLKFTTLNPIIPAPFMEADFRCFAVMEAIAKRLVGSLDDIQDVKISVIMPIRNRAFTLSKAIDSVLKQRYRNFELIVVDDASSDASATIVECAAATDSRIQLIRLQQHEGVSIARNKGLASATGDVIGYLDSDNTWLDDYLGTAVAAFHLLPQVDAIYSGQYIYADCDLEKLSAVRFGSMNKSLLEQHNYIDLNCFLHRRHVLDIGIRFDESLARLVDWDFILQINSRFRIASVPVLLSNYYLHAAENTITKTIPIESAMESIASRQIQMSKFPVNLSFFKKICIVIPSYQALHFLRNCVDSLRPYLENELIEAVIVDNCSSAEVKTYLQKISNKKIKVILNDVNYGFSYAVNQGAALASPEADIVVMNNDARFEANSLEHLQNVAYEASDIAISVPRQILPADAADMNLHVPYANLNLECDVSLSIHHKNIESIDLFHDGCKVELNFAPFFCVYIKRKIWMECGGLDYENGRHYRSDRIMCDFIRQVLHQRIVYTPDAKVHHAGQISTKELNRDDNDNHYRTMLIKNMWPTDLMADLNIHRRPWIIR